VPAGQGGNFMKQFAERGLDKAGIKMIGPGDVTQDTKLQAMGDAAVGLAPQRVECSADVRGG
jgi:branched-chain amino acid transport system substrate-binding protein